MSHVIYCILYWKWITEWLCGYRTVVSILVVHPHDYVVDWELQLATTAQNHERIQHIASPGKDQNSKLAVLFLLNVYHFWIIIKSKNLKLNHHKSGNICIVYRHTSFYSALLYCISQILHFLQIGALWQHWVEQVYQCHFFFQQHLLSSCLCVTFW